MTAAGLTGLVCIAIGLLGVPAAWMVVRASAFSLPAALIPLAPPLVLVVAGLVLALVGRRG